MRCRSGGDGIRIADSTATGYSKARRRSARADHGIKKRARSGSGDGGDEFLAHLLSVVLPAVSPIKWLAHSGGAWISGAALLRLGTSDSSGTAPGMAALSAGARRPALVAAMTATSSSWRLRTSERFFDGISSIAGGGSAPQSS